VQRWEKRNIIMCIKRQRKTKRGRGLEDYKKEQNSKVKWNLGTTPWWSGKEG
jgi:hypothetical protein